MFSIISLPGCQANRNRQLQSGKRNQNATSTAKRSSKCSTQPRLYHIVKATPFLFRQILNKGEKIKMVAMVMHDVRGVSIPRIKREENKRCQRLHFDTEYHAPTKAFCHCQGNMI